MVGHEAGLGAGLIARLWAGFAGLTLTVLAGVVLCTGFTPSISVLLFAPVFFIRYLTQAGQQGSLQFLMRWSWTRIPVRLQGRIRGRVQSGC